MLWNVSKLVEGIVLNVMELVYSLFSFGMSQAVWRWKENADWSWKTNADRKYLQCNAHLEGLTFITLHFYSKNHRFMVLPWLFHGLKLGIAVFQAQSFTSPLSFRLPLNFSLGFANSFRIKLAEWWNCDTLIEIIRWHLNTIM